MKNGLNSVLKQMKEIKIRIKGYKYLDEAIELANELGLDVTDQKLLELTLVVW